MPDNYWFTDLSDDPSGEFIFSPFVQVDGSCLPLPILFDSREACDKFIREQVLTARRFEDA